MGKANEDGWRGAHTARRPLRAYIARHWRGELSLADSCLQSGLLAYLAVLSPCVSILLLAGQLAPEPLALLSEPFAWLIALPIATWHLAGIWRSAGRAAAGTGQRLDALLPRCAVLLAVLAIINLLWVRAVPEAREAVDIVFRGDPRIGPHVVRLLGATELELNGGLTIGVASEVEAQLAADPYVQVIHLNSPGGRLAEGIALEALIRRHRLITYTTTRCESACTLAFLGGRERWIGPSAVLGFHRPGPYPGETHAEAEQWLAAFEAELRRAGVAPDFVARVMATPFEQIWEPTTDELLDSGVATDQSDGSQFRISGLADTSPQGIEQALLAEPGLAALRALDAAAFGRLRTAVAAAVGEGRNLKDVWQRMLAEMGQPMRRHLPQASEQAVAAIASFWVAAIDGSYLIDCRDLLAGTLNDAELKAIEDLGAEYFAAIELVFQSAAAGPAPALPVETARQAVAELRTALAATYGQDVALLDAPDAPGGDPTLLCRMRADLYRSALALPAVRRGEALRALVAQ
jgi:hypothetical protein